jgi:predicted Ser/Thr protein kinase
MGSQGDSEGTSGRLLDDRYELVELIGSGGMAEVWRANDRRLHREVAVKVISGSGAREPSNRKRIEREARALAAAHHPNIVAVYDYGEAPEDTGRDGDVVPYIVMELVDGPDLQRYVRDRGPLPVDEVRAVLRGVLDGVERAHDAGVVHGDLKSGNVFVGSHGPKVGDFGVARILGQETGTTTVAATPTYAAPEILRGERATAASDVYSASCLAFELLTGRPPYEGANGWEVAQKHLEAPPPRLRSLRSDVPRDLEDAITRGMEKDPRRRFASAAAFATAIGSASEAGATVAVAPPPVPPSSATVPLGGSSSEAHPTETIAGRGPDVARLAVFGPFAAVWDRLTAWRGARADSPDRTRRGWLIVASAALLLLLGLLALTRDRGPEAVAVPDVEGERVIEASAQLRTRGFDVAGVSYRPVTEGEAGVVLATIPDAKELVEPGTSVHLIVSAHAATPQPVVTRNDGDGDDGDGDRPAKRGKGRGKKRDD